MAGFDEIFEKDNRDKLVYAVLFTYIVICILLYLIILWRKVKIPKFPRKILLITSHPDDECMFFSPTVQAETSKGNFVYILCLTKGDYYKVGERRKNELIKSCGILGIPDRNVLIVDHEKLPDSPDIKWDMDVLEKEILSVVYGLQPNKVVTFDSYGVSGHNNHRSVYHSVHDICEKKWMPKREYMYHYYNERLQNDLWSYYMVVYWYKLSLPQYCGIIGTSYHYHNIVEFIIADTRVFVLRSTSMLRKFSSILDLPLTYILSKRTFVSSPVKTFKAWRAMFAHRSQLMWFRIIYLMFSNYMFVNSLQEVCHHGDC